MRPAKKAKKMTARMRASRKPRPRSSIDAARERLGFHPLFHVLLMGVGGAFLAGDLFNLYVWFEVLLMASFVLLALGGTRAQLEGAVKYVTLNLISSGLFLAAAGIAPWATSLPSP